MVQFIVSVRRWCHNGLNMVMKQAKIISLRTSARSKVNKGDLRIHQSQLEIEQKPETHAWIS